MNGRRQAQNGRQAQTGRQALTGRRAQTKQRALTGRRGRAGLRYVLLIGAALVLLAGLSAPAAVHASAAAPAAGHTVVAQGAAAMAAPAPISMPVHAPRGLWAFLGLACAMGALSLLTPCVFPMIPITVSYFTKSAAQSRKSALRGAVTYAVGIIVTFTALGAALALIFGAAGVDRLAANPWVNLAIAVIFIAFALTLFEMFLIRLPSGLTRAIGGRQGTAGGTVGTLLMGLTFSVTSFTCTAPFVGTLLVLAARGSWRLPILGMLAFSTVFALPFFFLALAPQLVSQLPRSGNWLQAVKVVMGFLEIAAAMKFLANADLIWHWNIFTRQTVLAIWVLCGLATVIYLLGRLPIPHQGPLGRPTPARGTLAVAFLAITVWLGSGLWGHRLGELESFLPPLPVAAVNAEAAGPVAPTGRLEWIVNNLPQAEAAARRDGRPLFIDFTGYTCTNCRWMEANMFPRPEVKAALARFVRVELYTDGAGATDQSQQRFENQHFGTVALPLYAIVSPAGKTLATFPGLTRNPNEFLAFLQHYQSRQLD